MDNKTPSMSSSPPRPPVKKENEEEVKDFAETAMNELLGWYGYERLELRRWAASRAKDASSPEQNSEQKEKDECSWCNKSVSAGETAALQHAGSTFCSELCFSQSRRANFKRAKTCDWCRHVRHTVAYVDFQDGATQLQFCSDKCLNQYKMHIFCRETQAHLDLNPHLVTSSSTSNLITPELWLKNCRSRSASPNSDRSVSPAPENMAKKKEEGKPRRSPLALITVAPTAKLMKPKKTSDDTLHKSPDAKKDLRSTKLNLRKRRTSKSSATVTSQTARLSSTPKAQDLRICSPSTMEGSSPVSTIGNSTLNSPTHPMHQHPMPPPFPNPLFGMPAPVFMDNIPHGPMNDHRLPNMFPPRHNFMPRMPMPHEIPRLPPQISLPQGFGQPPPITVMVPYPVILPIPLPIPIPMPMSAFIQAHLLRKVKTEVRTEDNEGPLDFTMNGDRNKDNNKPDEPVNFNDKETASETNIEVNGRLDPEERSENGVTDSVNPEQTLPKFKITRLGNKMAKIVTKPREQAESSRPLRKRRRLVEVTTDDEPLITKARKIVQV